MRYRILVPGTFDILHIGHFIFLQHLSNWGDVIVALSTDENASAKRKPILNYHERWLGVDALPWVANVVPKDELSLHPIIDEIAVDALAYGSDWSESSWLNQNGIDHAYLLHHNMTLIRVINGKHLSTTEIIGRILGTS